MYSWGSARGSARPTACPPCRGRFSRGDRGTLRPRPPLEEAASSEEAGREAGRQQGKSQRRLASKAAESRARRAFIARGGGGGEEEEGGPTCGSGGPRSGAGTARRRGAERGLHPGGLGPEQPAPPRGYRPAADRPVGAPSPPPRGGPRRGGTPRGRVLGGPFAPSSLWTPRGKRTRGPGRDAVRLAATLRVPLLINPPTLWCVQVPLGCCSFGSWVREVRVWADLCDANDLAPGSPYSHGYVPESLAQSRGLSGRRIRWKVGSHLGMSQGPPSGQPRGRPCHPSEREGKAQA